MRFADFAGKHKGEDIIVIGCGESAMLLKQHPCLGTITTIGVNDVGLILDPTYLIVVDAPNRFQGTRNKLITDTKAQYVFTQMKDWKINPPEKKVLFRLGGNRLRSLFDANTVDYSNNSPYVGAMVAFKMGAKRIGMIGVDFTHNHFYAKDGEHILTKTGRIGVIDSDYAKMVYEFSKHSVLVYNLSPITRLNAIPKMSLDAFLKK